ncbi:hypothetical protein V6N13_134489 [Hibiscus sabdariffa]|uniref:Uncharacterized protein n=2 Tax=Hibiscus sabdariffa TaxID=183260 RepID=A0ABR1ZLG8_9ROSI
MRHNLIDFASFSYLMASSFRKLLLATKNRRIIHRIESNRGAKEITWMAEYDCFESCFVSDESEAVIGNVCGGIGVGYYLFSG